MKKIFKVLLWVVGIVLALLIVVSVVAGPVAKSYVNKHGEELLGCRVEVERVGVNLLTGSVKVRGLSLYEADSATVFAGFDTLSVRALLLQLPFKTVNVRHITLAGLHANIVQDGERFNFSPIIDHFSSDDTTETVKDTTPSEWTLKFYNIRISHANLSYNDLRGRKQLRVPDVNLRVPGFVLGGDEDTEGGLNLAFDKGGLLNANAGYDAASGSYNATLNIDHFLLSNIEGYVTDVIDLSEMAGSLSASIAATGSSSQILNSHISAKIHLDSVNLEGGGSRLAGLDRLSVTVDDINLYNNTFDIAEVHLDGLFANYEQWDGSNNISRLMVKNQQEEDGGLTMQTTLDEPSPTPQPAADTTAVDKQPLKLHVGSVVVENCALTYTDHTMPEPFSFPVTGLSITASNLSTGGDNNALVRATLPGGGRLVVRWNGDISNWKRHQDLFLTVKGLDMRQLSPLAMKYTGYPLEEGIFGLTSRNTINASSLSGQNVLDIYKVSVGDRRKDVDPNIKIPLKAALYVLKDKDDKILIDMPVKGNVDSPEFNYMKVVWKTLGNLLVKVATSPARALGNALGMNGENLEFLPVDPSQHSLTSEQYHTLGQLATIAMADSLLTLRLELRMPAAGDTSSRHSEMLNRQVMQYLTDQGVDANRVTVTSATAEPKEPTGYAISSELILKEEE